MGFLLAKILLFGIVAAILGALFTRWYLRRNMREVTGEYTQMQANALSLRQSLEKLIAQRPQPDFAPLHSHLEHIDSAIAAIPGLVIPVPQPVDLSVVLGRLTTLEQAVREIVIPPATQVDLQPILQRLSEIDTHLQKDVRIEKAAPASIDESRVVPVSIVVSKAVNNSPSVRVGSRNLLSHAGFGTADNLQLMKGVKGVMEKMLHDIGVYYFWQIAEWSEADVLHADAQLKAFHGRIQRDEWVAQAVELASAPDAASKPDTVGVEQIEQRPSSPSTEQDRLEAAVSRLEGSTIAY